MAYLPSRICPLQFQLQVEVGPRHDFSPTLVILFLGQEPWLSVLWWTLFPTCQSSTESMFLDTGDAWWLWYWCVKDIDLFFYHVFFLLLIACHPQDSHEDSPPLIPYSLGRAQPQYQRNLGLTYQDIDTFLTTVTGSGKSRWPKLDPVLASLGTLGEANGEHSTNWTWRIMGAGAENEADLVEGRAGDQEKLGPW